MCTLCDEKKNNQEEHFESIYFLDLQINRLRVSWDDEVVSNIALLKKSIKLDRKQVGKLVEFLVKEQIGI